MHLHYITYLAQHKTAALDGMKFTILVDPSLVITTLYLVCLIYAWEQSRRFLEILHFHYLTYMATPYHKNPCLGGNEIYNFGRTFLCNHHYILSLSDLCLRVKKKNFKGIMHFQYMTYMATPQQKNPCPGGHEIFNFGRPIIGHNYYILGLSDQCLGLEKKLFKKHAAILHLLPPNYIPFRWGGGVMKFTISCLLTLQMVHTKFG